MNHSRSRSKKAKKGRKNRRMWPHRDQISRSAKSHQPQRLGRSDVFLLMIYMAAMRIRKTEKAIQRRGAKQEGNREPK